MKRSHPDRLWMSDDYDIELFRCPVVVKIKVTKYIGDEGETVHWLKKFKRESDATEYAETLMGRRNDQSA